MAEVVFLIGGLCASWLVFELGRLGRAAATAPTAFDVRTGRPLRMRRDRRVGGRRASDRRRSR